MGTFYVKNKEIVLPGQLLGAGKDLLLGEGTFRENEKIFASTMGLVEIKGNYVRVVPISGKYIPKPGDVVIGIIKEVQFSTWIVDINSPYTAVTPVSEAVNRFINLTSEDLARFFDVNDVVLAKVLNVTKSKIVGLTMKEKGLRKLNGGRIIEIIPTKIPRVIGKKGTMINLLKEKTGCKIVVGQNGRIWISGTPEKEDLLIRALKLIEREAHTKGLTEKVKKLLEEGQNEQSS